MSVNQKGFLNKLIVFGLSILGVAIVLYSTLLKSWFFPLFPVQFLLVFLVTAAAHLRIVQVGKQNMLRFTTAYIQMTMFKLLIYLVFIFTCLLCLSVDKLVFAITFFVLYALFSVFEAVQLISFYKVDKP
jgi:hypothetical protein